MITGYLFAGEHTEKNKLFAEKVDFLVVLVERGSSLLIIETLKSKSGSLESLANKLNNLDLPDALRLKDNELPPITMRYSNLRLLEPGEKSEFYKHYIPQSYEEPDACSPDEQN